MGGQLRSAEQGTGEHLQKDKDVRVRGEKAVRGQLRGQPLAEDHAVRLDNQGEEGDEREAEAAAAQVAESRAGQQSQAGAACPEGLGRNRNEEAH